MHRFKSRRAHRRQQPEVNLTPLVDTALTLLIIFMVATPVARHAIRVRLPDAGATSMVNNAEQFIVYIDQDKNVFFNEQSVTKETIGQVIEQALQNKKEKQTVFVKGDQAVPYGQIMEIVKCVQQTGNVSQVALSTRYS